MWGGEKIENEIERLVKILTKCKMKLRRRRKEEGGPAFRAFPPPSQAAARAPLPFLLLFSFPLIISVLSPSTQLHQPTSSSVSVCQPPRAGEQLPQLSLSSCFVLPFLLHKITEAAERGGCRVARRQLAGPASRPSCNGRPARPQARGRLSSTISRPNGDFSTSSGAIGKQRPKINYPVSFPSLTNK